MSRAPARRLAAVASLLLAAACARGQLATPAASEEPAEVLGIVVERSPSADAATDVTPSPTAPVAAATDTPAAPGSTAGDPNAGTSDDEEPPPSGPSGPPAPSTATRSPATPAAPPPASAAAAPSPTPPAPAVLAAGDGWSAVAWSPDGAGGWIEISALAPIERDDPTGGLARPLRVDLRDADTDTVTATPGPLRDALCVAWLQAPADRPLVADATVTVSLLVGGQAVVVEQREVVATLAPGERRELAPTAALEVDAGLGLDVTCAVAAT